MTVTFSGSLPEGSGGSSTTHTPVTVADGRGLDVHARRRVGIDLPVPAEMEHSPLTSQEKLMNAVDILKTRPGMEWLNEALARDDAVAHALQDTARTWQYEQSGLAPGAAAVLALAVTAGTMWAMAPAAGSIRPQAQERPLPVQGRLQPVLPEHPVPWPPCRPLCAVALLHLPGRRRSAWSITAGILERFSKT